MDHHGPGREQGMTESESRDATLTSDWLINRIREHGGAMTVVRDVVVD